MKDLIVKGCHCLGLGLGALLLQQQRQSTTKNSTVTRRSRRAAAGAVIGGPVGLPFGVAGAAADGAALDRRRRR